MRPDVKSQGRDEGNFCPLKSGSVDVFVPSIWLSPSPRPTKHFVRDFRSSFSATTKLFLPNNTGRSRPLLSASAICNPPPPPSAMADNPFESMLPYQQTSAYKTRVLEIARLMMEHQRGITLRDVADELEKQMEAKVEAIFQKRHSPDLVNSRLLHLCTWRKCLKLYNPGASEFRCPPSISHPSPRALFTNSFFPQTQSPVSPSRKRLSPSRRRSRCALVPPRPSTKHTTIVASSRNVNEPPSRSGRSSRATSSRIFRLRSRHKSQATTPQRQAPTSPALPTLSLLRPSPSSRAVTSQSQVPRSPARPTLPLRPPSPRFKAMASQSQAPTQPSLPRALHFQPPPNPKRKTPQSRASTRLTSHGLIWISL